MQKLKEILKLRSLWAALGAIAGALGAPAIAPVFMAIGEALSQTL